LVIVIICVLMITYFRPIQGCSAIEVTTLLANCVVR
jgi:hypothetical protein